MKRVGFLCPNACLGHLPPSWHPEGPQRLLHIVDALKRSDLWGRLVHIDSAAASAASLSAVHDEQYLQMLGGFEGECLDPDTFVSPGSLEAARHAAGAVIEAVDLCRSGRIARAFCAVRPPGHHAEIDAAMGFCLINNVAIGAAHALRCGFNRVFIIDFDAHHGNGTQHIFEESDAVFFFSSHQYPYYPETGKESEQGRGRGTGYTYNVQMLRGSGNKDYLCIYQDILPSVVRRFSPDIILVSAGYDIHADDRHADIRVTAEGIRGIVRAILTAADCPVVFSLEGGYDLDSLADSVAITIEEMLSLP